MHYTNSVIYYARSYGTRFVRWIFLIVVVKLVLFGIHPEMTVGEVISFLTSTSAQNTLLLEFMITPDVQRRHFTYYSAVVRRV